jgi:hypothetical protein
MTRLILPALMLALSVLTLHAQSTLLSTDRSGYTTGIDGSSTLNTYTDRYGNTTGWIGGKYISTYSESTDSRSPNGPFGFAVGTEFPSVTRASP